MWEFSTSRRWHGRLEFGTKCGRGRHVGSLGDGPVGREDDGERCPDVEGRDEKDR